MKLEKIDGEQFIVLEENDEIHITTASKLNKNDIEIKEQDGKINIFGDSALVDSIKGDGMLEKVYIPPIVSKEEIIEKCDRWLEMFKQVHDKFKEAVLSYEVKQRIMMELSFQEFISYEQDGTGWRTVKLDLSQYGTTIQEGVKISVSETNEDIYAYLIANVINYYLLKNYSGTQIDCLNPSWNHTLYSNLSTSRGECEPMMASLSNLYDANCYAHIVKSLLASHNLGISTDQIISNLRDKISNQPLDDRFNQSIDYSSKQYNYIIGDSPEETVTTGKSYIKKANI